jgi:hypothetical protein
LLCKQGPKEPGTHNRKRLIFDNLARKCTAAFRYAKEWWDQVVAPGFTSALLICKLLRPASPQYVEELPAEKTLSILRISCGESLDLASVLDGFEGKLSTSKYAKLAKTSQDTALRDMLFLVEKGILVRNPEGGRSTSYSLARTLVYSSA